MTILAPGKWIIRGGESKKFYNFLDLFIFLLIHGRKYDIIKSYDTSINSLITLLVCGFIFKKPVVVTSHGHVEQLVYKSKLKHKIRIIIDRFILSNSTAIFAASESLKNFCERFNTRVFFVPTWGVDEKIFEYKKKKRTKDKIIYIGRIEPVKRIDFLIDSYINSTLRKRNISFYLIGPVTDRNYFQKLLIKYKTFVNSNVFFTGGIPQKELVYYFESSYCLFMGSQTEGLPHPVLEAIAMKVPVVSSNVGDISKLIIEGINGYSYPLNSSSKQVGELLDKVCEIEDIPDNYSIEIIKNYTVNSSNEREIQYLQEILEKKRK